MSSPDDKKKRSDQETLDAVFDEAELDEHVEDIGKMSPEELARELARAGVDVEGARAQARRQLEGGQAGKVVTFAPRRRRRVVMGAVAGALAAAAVVFAVLLPDLFPDRNVSSPRPRPPADAAADADAED